MTAYMMVPASANKPDFDPVISAALLDPIIKMCEQAAEGHKSKAFSHQDEVQRVMIMANSVNLLLMQCWYTVGGLPIHTRLQKHPPRSSTSTVYVPSNNHY